MIRFAAYTAAETVSRCFQWAADNLQSCPVPWGSRPHLIMVLWAHPSQPQRQLDQLSRFYRLTIVTRLRQTDTDRPHRATPSVAICRI